MSGGQLTMRQADEPSLVFLGKPCQHTVSENLQVQVAAKISMGNMDCS